MQFYVILYSEENNINIFSGKIIMDNSKFPRSFCSIQDMLTTIPGERVERLQKGGTPDKDDREIILQILNEPGISPELRKKVEVLLVSDSDQGHSKIRRSLLEYLSCDDGSPEIRQRRSSGSFNNGEPILNRYLVNDRLGQGGMGVVYKCFDTVSKTLCAIKTLPPLLSGNRNEMEDIKENYQLVSTLDHQNIAVNRGLEYDGSIGSYYLIMECVEGTDLRSWLKRKRKEGPVTLEMIFHILKQVAAALDYAHNHTPKVIHGDIKPGNIMIDGSGNVKVIDFGIAAQIHTSMTRVSMAYQGTSGTAPYMAPEQWNGAAQDKKADQYALAVMAYEMFAGNLPFDSSDPAVLREAVLKSPVRPIEGVPRAVNEALERGLSKDPSKRFNSCSEFAEALAGSSSGKGKGIFKGLLILLAVLVSAAGAAGYSYRHFVKEFFRNKAELPAAPAEAVKCYRKSAEQGDAAAQFLLGACYANGSGVSKDLEEAVKWYRKSAEQGYAAAQFNLGWCYEYGKGVSKDLEEAVKWLRKSAEQGNAAAQYNLGLCYANGKGVSKDLEEAVKWYRKSAEQGDAAAQYNLGWCYDNGRGVSKDLGEAVKWYRKSAEQGVASAKKALRRLGKE